MQEDTPITITYRQLDDIVKKVKDNKAKFGDLADVAWSGEYSDLFNEPEDFTDDEWDFLWTI